RIVLRERSRAGLVPLHRSEPAAEAGVLLHDPCAEHVSRRDGDVRQLEPRHEGRTEPGRLPVDTVGAAPQVNSLNAWPHSFRTKPRMHQSMQSGSIARADSAFPMSAVSQPNCSRSPVTVFLAPS